MKKRRAKRTKVVSVIKIIESEFQDLTIRMNELEGLGRCIEGQLEMLKELLKDKGEE